jgi:hypothetical protein
VCLWCAEVGGGGGEREGEGGKEGARSCRDEVNKAGQDSRESPSHTTNQAPGLLLNAGCRPPGL